MNQEIMPAQGGDTSAEKVQVIDGGNTTITNRPKFSATIADKRKLAKNPTPKTGCRSTGKAKCDASVYYTQLWYSM